MRNSISSGRSASQVKTSPSKSGTCRLVRASRFSQRLARSGLRLYPYVDSGVCTAPLTCCCAMLCGVISLSVRLRMYRCYPHAACGTLLVGPVMHNWYGFLAVKFPPSLGAYRMTFSKMAVDQVRYASWLLAAGCCCGSQQLQQLKFRPFCQLPVCIRRTRASRRKRQH